MGVVVHHHLQCAVHTFWRRQHEYLRFDYYIIIARLFVKESGISPLKYYLQSSVFTSHSDPAVTLSDPVYKYMIVSYFERGSARVSSFVARR